MGKRKQLKDGDVDMDGRAGDESSDDVSARSYK